ncbi:hypothetical protein C6501_16990 [Candidatus Poribacteria bacterium]|nr:MAG: hypothetical protein C6501_16990 [Candidatus Poribacteria bacterium]
MSDNVTATQEPTIFYFDRESPLYEDMEDILERKESDQLKFYTHEEIWKEYNDRILQSCESK